MHRGQMSWRRLRVLIQHLPPESVTWTALRNAMPDEEIAAQANKGEPEKGRWSQEEQLLALIADRVADLGYLYASANTPKGSKKPVRPTPVRRPSVKAPQPKPTLSGDSANFLFQLINGGAE